MSVNTGGPGAGEDAHASTSEEKTEPGLQDETNPDDQMSDIVESISATQFDRVGPREIHRHSDPASNAERQQQTIVRVFLFILGGTIGCLLFACVMIMKGVPGADQAVDEIATRVLTPVLGVTGVFVGFYFAEKRSRK